MKLPAEVMQIFDPSTLGEPRVAVHSLFDLEGDVGETHLVADGRVLHLFSRKLGGAFEATSSPLDRVEHMNLSADGLYEVLRFRMNGQARAVRFTSWDQPELERLRELWRAVAPRGTEGDGGAAAAIPRTPDIRIPVASRVLLAASLEAMAEADGEMGESERLAIGRVLGDSPSEAQGADYLRKHGLEAVLSVLEAGLSASQKRCLLANLLAVAMSDGLLRSAEQALMDRFRGAIGLSEKEFKTIYDVLLTQHNVAVFATDTTGETGPGGLTPIEVFCASLYALAREDGRVAGEELEALERVVPDEAQWTVAAETSTTRGWEGLRADVGRLNRAQQRCLLTNLLALAMSDGWLRGVEQAEIERFRQAMNIPTEDYAVIYRVLMAKDDLSVFPES
jgi:uncharacterized tellurite resistance protein B-like protein